MDGKITFKIRLEGHLNQHWLEWFCNGGHDSPSQLVHAPGGETIIRGEVPDQSAFYGILTRISDLGLTVRSIVAVAKSQDGVSLSDFH